jgi:16S rRNA (guanine966-N2)-methyltransferase
LAAARGFARAMRIIAGEFRSRRLVTPRDATTTRPIPDRVKESLFGHLRGHTEGARVFDAFAGTGAIGLEAISRGAARCVFVERDRRIADLLRQNIANLGVEDRCEVVVGDALGPGALARCPHPVDLVFLDPPYALATDPVGWKRMRAQLERLVDLLDDDGFAMVRTPWPFFLHPEAPAEPAPARARQRRDKDRGERPADRQRPPKRSSHTVEEEDDAVAQPPAPAAIEPGMLFSNADGPETHVYHTTAVHLYAKRAQPASPS